MAVTGIYAPNNTLIRSPLSVQRSTQILSMADIAMQVAHARKEIASDYVAPILGTQPGGLGFTFGDTWRRTQHQTMEFQMPTTQVDIMNTSFRLAVDNVFIGKAMKIKTDFTCKNLRNKTPNAPINKFFDSVIKSLRLQNLYRKAVWMYYTLGMVVLLMPPANESLSWVELLDPRMCRVFEAFGKKVVYIVPDERMLNAVRDKDGKANRLNKDFYDMMPLSWRTQLAAALKQQPNYIPAVQGNRPGEILIRLDPGSFLVMENRLNSFSRYSNGFDGAPLQKYFAAAEQHRMLMAGDFASAFVAKNLLALVSIGDPDAEGENYQRPDTPTLTNLAAAFGTPNSAQYMFGDPTFNVRYITPDPDTYSFEKYRMPWEMMKNLLPSAFWWNDGQGAYASSVNELKWFRDEIDATNDDFDRNFWIPLFERAAQSTSLHVSVENLRAPMHDKNSLTDDATLLAQANMIYGNGGMSVHALLETFGYDYDTTRQEKLDELKDVHADIWVPAFESKQGITGEVNYDMTAVQTKAETENAPPPVPGAGKPGGNSKSSKPSPSARPAGRPSVPGSKPQAERPGGARTPRKAGK